MQKFIGVLTVAFCSLAAEDMPKLRLPSGVQPRHYDLALRLLPSEPGFSGRVVIEVEISRPVSTIWLHATDLEIREAKVGGVRAQAVSGSKDLVALKLPSDAPAGKSRIEMEFAGKYNTNDVEGIFRQTESGNAYLFTQFEPISARKAFPCFDEPGFKVPWSITVDVPADLGAFSNTPAISEKREANGLKQVRFAETKPLPSYLVALAVGPFEVVDGGKAGKNKVPLRVLAPKGRGSEAAYVTKVTPRIVGALEEYFGLPYPYEKLDQVAIPITVGFEAMENAGLVTYAQTLLLARPDKDSIGRQREAVIVIAHELAHQWFGNMVTPVWWDDIWLNEAFASWMETVIANRLFPDWDASITEVVSKATVMNTDQLTTARRIRQPIESNGDIGHAFDGITYQKGDAVISMFENYLGPKTFRNGVHSYMRKHMWGSATAADFLSEISAAAGRDIAPQFSQFLDRAGLPLLTVDLKCDGTPRLAVYQERSLPIGSKGAKSEYWPTPVCLRYGANGKVSRECVLLTDPKQEIPLKSVCPTWITANDQAHGYYHVLYGGALQRQLLNHADQLSAAEKVDLLRNALAMTKSGRLPASDAFDLAYKFHNDSERQILTAAVDLVGSLRRAVPPDMEGAYATLVSQYFGARAKELGWHSKKGEDEDVRILRPRLMSFVALYGKEPGLAAEARQLAEKWFADRSALEPDMVTTVLNTAAWHGDRAFYDLLIRNGKASKDQREREEILNAVGSFRDPAIARDALGLLLRSDFDIRELLRWIPDFERNRKTETVAWEFVKANYDPLLARLPSMIGVDGGTILIQAARGFCSANASTEVRSFFGGHVSSITGGARSLAQSLEQIELCDAWHEALLPQISDFLTRNQVKAAGLH